MYPKFMLVGGGGKQWSILIHNGPMFPPLYVPHNIPIVVNGKSIKLNPLAEEYITMYARYIDTEYVKNPKFNKNFFSDWKKVLGGVSIDKIENVDLTEIKKYLNKIKEEKSNMSKEEKLILKNKQEKLDEPYKYCFIDGGKQKVGNFKIEPPGIFLGRGEHPKLGKIKNRVEPEDVTINISRTHPIPKPNVPGKWKEVVHNNEVVWLATWVDNISGKNKYIFTSMESIFKSKSDKDKFDLARQLKKKVNDIRTKYYVDMKENNLLLKQNSTAVYLIDNLALRVGGKKDTKEKADTVGVTSLRVEHIILFEENIIKLDFLGKDSVRYCKKVQIDPVAYANIKDFTLNKGKKELLFDKITPTQLNNYLDSMLKGLTAKVWRTYNASILFQHELERVSTATMNKLPEEEKINYLMSVFNQANTAVAILCNHQKNVSSNLEKSVDTIDNAINKLKDKKKKTKNGDKLKLINAKLVTLKMKKDTKIKQKNVSLGTSKNNYIDPRIIFAFQKKYNIPQDKLFNTALITRFEWASDVSSDFKF